MVVDGVRPRSTHPPNIPNTWSTLRRLLARWSFGNMRDQNIRVVWTPPQLNGRSPCNLVDARSTPDDVQMVLVQVYYCGGSVFLVLLQEAVSTPPCCPWTFGMTTGCLLGFMLADDIGHSLDGPSSLSESSLSLLRKAHNKDSCLGRHGFIILPVVAVLSLNVHNATLFKTGVEQVTNRGRTWNSWNSWNLRAWQKTQRTIKIYCSQRFGRNIFPSCTTTKVNGSGLVSNGSIVYSINDVHILSPQPRYDSPCRPCSYVLLAQKLQSRDPIQYLSFGPVSCNPRISPVSDGRSLDVLPVGVRPCRTGD